MCAGENRENERVEKGTSVALISSLNTAVSGLKAQQFRIEVIGNNIANVDTTAFKGTRADFATLLSQTRSFGVEPHGFLGGIDPVQVGLGTRVASTVTNFNQGPSEATGVATDLAIQGNGFFIMTDEAGGLVFSRDGSFTINPSNLLHDPATGFLVQGYAADENFQVVPGGALGNLEIPVGTLTIARATGASSFAGNLNSSGTIADQGSHLASDRFYDDRFTNSDLISAENPLGLARATSSTPLANLVRSLGDYISYSSMDSGTAGTAALVFPELATQPTGVAIQIAALKGDREIPGASFTVGDPPPTGGSTLGDFFDFLRRTLGVNDGTWDGVEQGEHMLSYQRTISHSGEAVNGTISLGVSGGPDDGATLSSLVDYQADFHSVEPGDFIRFTSGAAAGQIAEIVAVSTTGSSAVPNTLTFRTDSFNSLSVVPATGDSYAIHAPAGVRMAQDTTKVIIDSSLPSITVAGPSSIAGSSLSFFTVTDSSVSDFASERGLRVNQRVDYQSGGSPVSGWITDISGDTITVSYDSSTSQPPDASSAFSVVEQATGSIEIAGNTGSTNNLSNIELTSAGNRIVMFDNPPDTNATGESVTMTSTVYDSLGTPRQVQLTFVFEGSSANGPNTWRYFAESVEDSDRDRIVGSGTVTFSSNGQFLTTGRASEMVSIDLQPDPMSPGGVTTPFLFEVDLSRLTGFATTTSEVHMVDQDGFPSGTLRQFAFGADGLITGVFSNGLTRTLGQVALANFANPNGLESEGDNLFRAAPNSGVAQIGTAGAFGRGTVRSGFLEESNVDLAEQFTDLIIGQRAFQANARTITVSDEMLQELVNLI